MTRRKATTTATISIYRNEEKSDFVAENFFVEKPEDELGSHVTELTEWANEVWLKEDKTLYITIARMTCYSDPTGKPHEAIEILEYKYAGQFYGKKVKFKTKI